MTLEPVFRDVERLKSNFSQFQILPDDPEIRSHWARYLCVLTAGLLETSMRTILEEYVRRCADERVKRNFASRQERGRNPKKSEIVGILKSFDEDWGREIREFLSERQGDSVDSVMNNRNRIAHGGDVEIGPADMERYFREVVEVIEYMDGLVLGAVTDEPSNGGSSARGPSDAP